MSPSALSEALRAQVRLQAGNRCGYCLARQEYVPWPLEIEHIIPRSKGGTDDESNLWLACRACNLHKSDRTHGRDPLTAGGCGYSTRADSNGSGIFTGARMAH